MASTNQPNSHTTTKDPEKSVDVPPYGSRNPDPLTDQPGSHPVETGIGAVLGGVASGLAVGMVAGPVGAVIGAIAGGAAAGGLAGKGIGELIDPTTEDNWLREYTETSRTSGTTTAHSADDIRPAYRYGMETAAKSDYAGKRYEEVEPELRTRYESDKTLASRPWGEVRGAVKDAYDRTLRLHEERRTQVPVDSEELVRGRQPVKK